MAKAIRKGSTVEDVGENPFGLPEDGKIKVHAHDDDMVVVEWSVETATITGEPTTAPRLATIPRKAWEKFAS